MIYVDLIFNLALLVALSVISGFINQRWPRDTHDGRWLQGFLFGSAAVIGMLRPFVLAQGLIFDGRSVLLSLCAFYFGPLSALIATVMTIACRVQIGGGGMWTGVLVILSSVGIGLMFHSRRKPQMNPPSAMTLYVFGIVVHLAMLLMMLAMPAGTVWVVLKHISLPVMLLYPLATILVGKILSDQEVNARFLEDLKAQRDLLESEIVERKQAQEATRKSEEIFGLFMQNSPIYVFFKDAQIRSLRLSRNYEQMLGRPMHELLGKTMDELFPSELSKKMVADDLRILQDGKQEDIEEELNGRYYATVKFPIYQDGKPQYLAGYTIDITERKEAEKALRESEAKFRKLLECTPLPLAYVSKEGVITFRNERFIKVFGYTNEDVPTLTEWWLNAYPDPQYRQWVIQNWESAVSRAAETNSDIQADEYHVTCKDGRVREVIISGIMVSDNYLITLIDITERKKSEEALQESERRLSETQQMAQLGHWIWDIKSGNVEWSQEVYHIFHLDPIKFIPHIDSILALSPWPEDHQRDQELIQKTIESHDKGTYEQRFLRPDNSIGYYHSTFQGKYDEKGNLVSIVGTIQDITERKRLEVALEKRVLALTRPLGDIGDISFEDLFSLPDIQRLQDDFAFATNVASIITHPDGTPITSPSNFSRFCEDIIRKTELGCANCYKSDASVRQMTSQGSAIFRCLSAGLWDAGAAITVGGRHIANWLIGQVRDETQTEDQIIEYAREIGVDEAVLIEAFHDVPTMSRARFEQIVQVLITLTQQISTTAYQNVQQARFITENKQAETALKESEQRLQFVLKGSQLGYWDWNIKTNEVKRNEHWLEMLGYSLEDVEFADKLWIDFVHPDDQQMASQAVLDHVEGRTPIFRLEYRMRTRDGQYKWILDQAQVVEWDSNHNPMRMSGTHTDITERKQADELLQKSEEHRRLAQEAAHSGSWEWNLLTNENIWSEELWQLYGLNSNSCESSFDTWLNTVHPDDRNRVQEIVSQSASKGMELNVEWRILQPDGSYRWLMSRGRPFHEKNGTVTRYFGIVLDITERKRAEEELKFASKRLKYITQMTGSVIGSGTIHEVAESLLSQIRECFEVDACIIRILDNGQLNLLASDGVPEAQLNISLPVYGIAEQILRTRKPVSIMDIHADPLTRNITDPTSKIFPFISYAGIPLIIQEEIVGILGIYTKQQMREFSSVDIEHLQIVGSHVAIILSNENLFSRVKNQRDLLEMNITERKKMEEEKLKLQDQLAQAQKMESIGRLAGGVAHDFNNMLQTILGYTEMSMMDIATDSPIRENLLEIQKAGQRSADLTRQLLAFARKQTIAPVMMNLNEEVDSMLKMLTRLMGEDIELIWKPCSSSCTVKMDPSQIDQILVNLTINARDSITGIGSITIETDRVVFDDEYCFSHDGFYPGMYVILAISDNGCGMDESTLSHIFEPFFTTKGIGKGTGLGLATVYGIMKQNNGFINVYSKPGIGTTIKVYIPEQDADYLKTPESLRQPGIPGGTQTVLLVEDDESLLQLAKQMLSKLGYTVLSTHSPRKAIELSMEYNGTIHLLMTDVVMPELSGRDLWGQIHQQRTDMKCLYMSGYTKDMIAHQGILQEGIHFIQKPFSREALAQKIHEIL